MSARQAERPGPGAAIRARRALPAAAAWIVTLLAVYLAFRRSGAYGLVADAQNLIALFGVLRAAAYAIEAHKVIRRRGFAGLFPRNFARIPSKREYPRQQGSAGNSLPEL